MRVRIPDFEPVLRDPGSRSPLCRKLYTADRDVAIHEGASEDGEGVAASCSPKFVDRTCLRAHRLEGLAQDGV
jgi:hypothetical protein